MVKKRLIALALLVCLSLGLVTTRTTAASEVCFTAINNTLQPLDSTTMPIILGSLLYIPCSFFSYNDLGINYFSNNDKALLYYGQKQLLFDADEGTVVDQDNQSLKIGARLEDGRLYVPLDEVSNFFGLSYQVITVEPAPIVRFINSSNYYSVSAFVEFNKEKLQSYYNAYVGTPSNTTAVPSPSVSPTFEYKTVYLTFYDLSENTLETVLNNMNTYQYQSCIFVTGDEIQSNADQLRRAAGAGHMLGVWLKDGTLEEYQQASALLFSATKIKTLLVCSSTDVMKKAADMATNNSLVYWAPMTTISATGGLDLGTLSEQLATYDSSRISISLSCQQNVSAELLPFLGFLAEKKYTVRRVTEVTAPTYTIT